MNRTIAIMLTLFAVAAAILVAVLLTIKPNIPDPGRSALTKYLNYRYSTSDPPVTIQQYTQATMPTQFTRAMSGTSFGDSNFYRTMVDYRATFIVNIPNLATPTPGQGEPTYLFMSMGTPIPFPPEDVWCVRLNNESQSEQVVFIALHQSLYNADWLIHEPPGDWSAAELSKTLSTIGCELKPGQ